MDGATLQVLDRGQALAFCFDDLVKYHGRSSIGGVALGYKVMERALPLLDGGQPPERHDIAVETAFPGPGAADAIEMVTRAVTGRRLSVDLSLGPDAPEAPEGRFWYRFRYRAGTVELTLRPGVVSEGFIALVRQSPRSPAEEADLDGMKERLAALVMAQPAPQVWDATVG